MSILIIGLLLSLMFIGIAFLINEKNADTLLAGYNSMTKEEKQGFPLKSALELFKKFHIFLGVSTALGLLLFWTLNLETWMVVWLGAYPIAAYIYLIYQQNALTKDSNNDSQNKTAYVAGVVMGITLLGIAYIFFMGMQHDQLVVDERGIMISGLYSLELPSEQISSLKIVSSLPKITKRINGYSVADIKKGYYRTASGKKVKLFINGKNNEILRIVDNNGMIYYFSDPDIRLQDAVAPHMQ